MPHTEPSVLVLIPAKNEEKRIEPVLREYAEYFRRNYAGQFSVVVVLNGCEDDTLGVVDRVTRDYPSVAALEFPAPIGKGGALIEGFKLANRADLIGYVDADGATAPAAFHDLIRHWKDADCIIASRWLPKSILHQAQTKKRQFASRVFHRIVRTLFPSLDVRDTQCGAKLMRREAAEKIHPALRIADMAFDINLLYALRRNRFSVLEIPTEWTDKLGSTVVLGRTSLVMFLSVVRLRIIYSPFAAYLRFLRPIEKWVYAKLRAPAPLPRPKSSLADREPNRDRQHQHAEQAKG
ncbi:MAG TPA: glycosyltransferase [Verrucomicrobiae bacterium]|nr:glycosyltransferase [Verrucomicrobiae bacterium]